VVASRRPIERWTNRCQDEAEARCVPEDADLMKEFEPPPVKGFLFNAIYRSQSDPDEVWLVVGFEDETTYRANADDPRTEMA
jgi:hypothetical protein